MASYRIPDATIEAVTRVERAELERYDRAYRDGRVPVSRSASGVSVPKPLSAVGLWYADFSQTTDEEVRHLLAALPAQHATAGVIGGQDAR